MTDREKDLQAEELADLARRLERALEVETPDARREKALFVAGVGSRARRSPWASALVPAAAAVVVLVVLAVVSRTALPGQTLYPVRKVLGGVGLAPSTAREVRERLDEAEGLVVAASGNVFSSPDRAQDLALRAMGLLRQAEELLDDVNGAREDELDDDLDALDDRAKAVYEEAEDYLEEREREPVGEERDDSSGRGHGGSGDDSSGPGSGDDDSSGSGPGSGDDDSSGSGSGSDDDSSGSGSGGDEDSSGPGSGGDD